MRGIHSSWESPGTAPALGVQSRETLSPAREALLGPDRTSEEKSYGVEPDTPSWRDRMIHESLTTCASRDGKPKGNARNNWVMQRKVHKEESVLAKGRDKGKIAKVVFCNSLK